ncbi:hypothetical protein ACFX2I_012131 [Malus domestica]
MFATLFRSCGVLCTILKPTNHNDRSLQQPQRFCWWCCSMGRLQSTKPMFVEGSRVQWVQRNVQVTESFGIAEIFRDHACEIVAAQIDEG